MKYLLIVTLLIATGTGSAVGQRTTPGKEGTKAWTTSVDSDAGYSIQFPVAPRSWVERLEDQGNLRQKFYGADPTPDRHFELSFVEFPETISDSAAFRTGSVADYVESLAQQGGKLVSQNEVVKGSCRGSEVVFTLNNPQTNKPSVAIARVFTAANMAFYLFFGGSGDTPAERALGNRFLNSFSVAGGCERAVTPRPASGLKLPPPTLDTASGWLRFDAPQGISFLFPGAASAGQELNPSPAGLATHYTYSYDDSSYLLSVEVYDGYKPQLRTSAAQQEAALNQALARQRQTMEAGGFKFGACTVICSGEIPGRECLLTIAGSSVAGRAQMFLTPTRTFFVTAFRSEPDVDELPLTRFLAALKIDPK